MLKSLALLIPRLRRLHAERNIYAASMKSLAEENNILRLAIQDISRGGDEENGGTLSKVPGSSSAVPRDVGYISDRGLFVVGHARSGTTILLDALNSCRDVYCLGEANFHKSIERPDFIQWFNGLHRSFDNPPMKSTCLPHFPANDGWDVLRELSKGYKLVGEKVAFRDEESGYDFGSFFRFSAKYFHGSNYICVIRHPRSVSGSCIEMFMSGQLGSASLNVVSVSQLQVYYLILSLVFSMPRVFILIHEHIFREAFDALGCDFGVDLRAAAGFYDFKKSVSKLSLHENIDDAALARPIYYYHLIENIVSSKPLNLACGIGLRDVLFELHSELKSIGRLPLLA